MGQQVFNINVEFNTKFADIIELYGIKSLGYNNYEAVVFNDLSKYNIQNVIWAVSDNIKEPTHMLLIDKLEIISNNCIRFQTDTFYDTNLYSFFIDVLCK